MKTEYTGPCPPPSARALEAAAWSGHFLVLTAALGLVVRLGLAEPGLLPHVEFWRHAHSHVAFLGWVFNAFLAVALVLWRVVDERDRRFRAWFWLLQVSVLGMMIAFPFGGYCPASLVFLTLHLLAAGACVHRLWRAAPAGMAGSTWLRASLVMLAVSFAGPLALGPLAASGLRESPFYLGAIHFYLHLHGNGWFVLFLVSALLRLSGGVETRNERWTAWLVGMGVWGTLPESWAGLASHPLLTACSAVGAVSQLAGFLLLGWERRTTFFALAEKVGPWFSLSVVALVLKLLLQALVLFPVLADHASERASMLGFLHLVFLGVVTPALFGLGLATGLLSRRAASGFAGLCWPGYVAGAGLMGAGFAVKVLLPEWWQAAQTMLVVSSGVLLLHFFWVLHSGSRKRGP